VASNSSVEMLTTSKAKEFERMLVVFGRISKGRDAAKRWKGTYYSAMTRTTMVDSRYLRVYRGRLDQLWTVKSRRERIAVNVELN